MNKPHDICPKCGAIDMAYYPIEVGDIADGDGLVNYYTDNYYHCNSCDKYFDEEMNICEKPIQYPLI